MNRFAMLLVGLGALAAGCGSTYSPSEPAPGGTTTTTFTVPLSPASEVPAITNAEAGSTGTATIALTVTKDAGGVITAATMNFQIDVSGLPAGATAGPGRRGRTRARRRSPGRCRAPRSR